LNIGAQLLCNDTIIILKIILLHSVSVITNFVTKKQRKNNTFLSTTGAQPRIPINMVIEEVRPVLHPGNFFDQIRSFAARGY